MTTAPALARRLGLFDAIMIVMGGIIGSGIFINPYVVAQKVQAATVFVFRKRRRGTAGFRVPGHGWATASFVLASFSVVANTIYKYPRNSAIGLFILLAGVPVYFFWSKGTQSH